MKVPFLDGIQETMSLIYKETHIFIALEIFTCHSGISSNSNRSIVSLAGNSVTHPSTNYSDMKLYRPLNEFSRVIPSVEDSFFCGHESYGDMRTFLQRNKIWNDDVQRIIAKSVEKFPSYIASVRPPSKRKVLIIGIKRNFNYVVFIDHF